MSRVWVKYLLFFRAEKLLNEQNMKGKQDTFRYSIYIYILHETSKFKNGLYGMITKKYTYIYTQNINTALFCFGIRYGVDSNLLALELTFYIDLQGTSPELTRNPSETAGVSCGKKNPWDW